MTHPTALPHVDAAFTACDLDLADRREGKVRVSYALADDRRLFVTTDRLSAFDRILAGVPYKGQVLNQLAAHWFSTTRHIVANHLVSVPDPNAMVGIAATPLPVEVVVRGHITGVTSTSLWRQYAEGARTIYGYDLPDGLRKNTELPRPIVTPTTKEEAGTGHDRPVTCAEVVELGLVEATLWDDVQAAALALFDHGRRVAAAAGLVLADTKFEFGRDAAGKVVLIDEVMTPDSSRYWPAQGWSVGEVPPSFDKQPLRDHLDAERAAGRWNGEAPPPPLPQAVIDAMSARYLDLYRRMTGEALAV